MWGIFSLAENVLDSQKGLCEMELVDVAKYQLLQV
jgi:hypothetical protein